MSNRLVKVGNTDPLLPAIMDTLRSQQARLEELDRRLVAVETEVGTLLPPEGRPREPQGAA